MRTERRTTLCNQCSLDLLTANKNIGKSLLGFYCMCKGCGLLCVLGMLSAFWCVLHVGCVGYFVIYINIAISYVT